MQATAFTSTFFDCPSCKVRTRLREVCVERDEVVHILIPAVNAFAWPANN